MAQGNHFRSQTFANIILSENSFVTSEDSYGILMRVFLEDFSFHKNAYQKMCSPYSLALMETVWLCKIMST